VPSEKGGGKVYSALLQDGRERFSVKNVVYEIKWSYQSEEKRRRNQGCSSLASASAA